MIDWPLFPAKFMVPLASFLLLLQGLAKFLTDLRVAITGRTRTATGNKAASLFGPRIDVPAA